MPQQRRFTLFRIWIASLCLVSCQTGRPGPDQRSAGRPVNLDEEFALNNYEEGERAATVGPLQLSLTDTGEIWATEGADSRRLLFSDSAGDAPRVARFRSYLIHYLGDCEVERRTRDGHAYGGTMVRLSVSQVR